MLVVIVSVYRTASMPSHIRRMRASTYDHIIVTRIRNDLRLHFVSLRRLKSSWSLTILARNKREYWEEFRCVSCHHACEAL